MPITFPPISRRQWIKGSLAVALSPHFANADTDPEGELWVLFSDTHIAADVKLEARGAVMGENLQRCVNQVLKIGQKPFGVLVNGDCAYLDGQQADYDTFVKLIEPLRESAIQVHWSRRRFLRRERSCGRRVTNSPVRMKGRMMSPLNPITSSRKGMEL